LAAEGRLRHDFSWLKLQGNDQFFQLQVGLIGKAVIVAVFRACNGFRTAFCSAAHDWLGNIGGVADYAQIAAE